MADKLLQLLTTVYYNCYYCGNHETLHVPRSSILLPGNHFVALGGGAGGGAGGRGGVSSRHKCKIQLNAPPFQKGGAYNRASTVYARLYSTI